MELTRATYLKRTPKPGRFEFLDGHIEHETAAPFVVVHNHIRRTKTTRPGVRGFRAWVTDDTADLELCPCPWSGLPHYRVALRECLRP
jgi:hypothetical protein